MLDTNMIIYARNCPNSQVKALFDKFDDDELCISAITLAELEYGASNSSDEERNRESLYDFLRGLMVMPFDSAAAREYGDIRAYLRRKGTPVGSNDMLIAAHARSLGLTLVTNNIREFERIEGLKAENWLN